MVSISFNRGFTLIEVVVAITLTSLLFLVLMSSIRIGGHAQNLVFQMSEKAESHRTVVHFIRQKLSQAYPLMHYENGSSSIEFFGSAEELSFAVEESTNRHTGGMRIYRIFTEKTTPTELSVWVSAHEYNLFQLKQSDKNRTTRLRGLRSISFEYFGAQNTSATKSWQSAWTDKSKLPSLVRVRYQLLREIPAWLVIPIHSQVQLAVSSIDG